MAEYIKREEVYQYLDNEVEWNVNQDRLYALEVISDFPAADVAEVRHGHWIDHHSGGSFCSACKRWVPYNHHPKYCETCGARMDKEAEHETS